mmetsp:Transcript_26544/g.82023  ORF Transcript_26544/g.82023 Transcript_26544/m.82023 type:complete len:391 (-) Transcript_26544:2385-3557(-)
MVVEVAVLVASWGESCRLPKHRGTDKLKPSRVDARVGGVGRVGARERLVDPEAVPTHDSDGAAHDGQQEEHDPDDGRRRARRRVRRGAVGHRLLRGLDVDVDGERCRHDAGAVVGDNDDLILQRVRVARRAGARRVHDEGLLAQRGPLPDAEDHPLPKRLERRDAERDARVAQDAVLGALEQAERQRVVVVVGEAQRDRHGRPDGGAHIGRRPLDPANLPTRHVVALADDDAVRRAQGPLVRDVARVVQRVHSDAEPEHLRAGARGGHEQQRVVKLDELALDAVAGGVAHRLAADVAVAVDARDLQQLKRRARVVAPAAVEGADAHGVLGRGEVVVAVAEHERHLQVRPFRHVEVDDRGIVLKFDLRQLPLHDEHLEVVRRRLGCKLAVV